MSSVRTQRYVAQLARSAFVCRPTNARTGTCDVDAVASALLELRALLQEASIASNVAAVDDKDVSVTLVAPLVHGVGGGTST